MLAAGDEKDPPIRTGIPIADVTAPLFGVIGTLAAMHEADTTGEGQHVDISMLGALTSLVACEGLDAMRAIGLPTRTGRYMPRLAPFGTFEATDGWFSICAPTDRLAHGVLRAMDRVDLVESEDFGTRDARVTHSTRLHALISGWSAERTLEEALEALRNEGVPAEPVRSPFEALQDEHTRARGDVVPLVHPVFGQREDLTGPGVPIVFSRDQADLTMPPPRLGEQNDAILMDFLGYSDSQITHLRASEVV
jgi:crotonobetainyl-CoA:carnitine CoA-transferase CaiB-like acyl-CoA transferase